MNLLVLGATGPTGRHLVDLALKGGDEVTVLARRPEALDGLAGRITVVAGDATSRDDVAKAMVGQDTVVSALGRSRSVRADRNDIGPGPHRVWHDGMLSRAKGPARYARPGRGNPHDPDIDRRR